MEPKKQKPRKAKMYKQNKDERNSYKQKPIISESGSSVECSSYIGDLESFLNKASKESANTFSNVKIICLNGRKSEDQSIDSADGTSKTESCAANKEHFISSSNRTVSELTTVKTTNETSSVSIPSHGVSEVLSSDQELTFFYGETNITECLNKCMAGSSPSSVTDTRQELNYLDEDKTNTCEKKTAESIEPKSDYIATDQEYLIPGTESPSTAYADEITYPLQTSITNKIHEYKTLMFFIEKEFEFLYAQDAEILKFLITNFTLVRKSCFRSSYKVKSSRAMPSLYSKCKNTYQLFLFKMKQFLLNVSFDRKRYHLIISVFKSAISHIYDYVQSQKFQKSKRNACIQGIYKKKVDEVSACARNVLLLLNDSLTFMEINYKIQLLKLEALLDKYKSDYKFCFNEENSKLLAEEFYQLNKIDVLRVNRFNQKILIVNTYVEKILYLIINFF